MTLADGARGAGGVHGAGADGAHRTGARGVLRAAALLAGVGAAAGAYATVVERNWFALRHATVPVRTPATRPLRLLHLSDLHLLPGQRRKQAFVRSCLQAAPDLVVVTGDMVGHPEAIDEAVALLGEAGRPAVAVLGSNDYFAPVPKSPHRYLVRERARPQGRRLETARLVEGLGGHGWTVLENERALVETAAGPVDVVGLGDAHIRRDRPDLVDWAPPPAPPAPVALRLGVAHSPYLRVLDAFRRHGFDLVLAGHTHGGQLRLPGVGALVNNCDLPLGRSRGLSGGDGEPWLHVSAGLGTSMFAPARFACRPEATLLDLVPAVGSAADAGA